MKLRKKLNINYWLRKIYTTKIFQKLPINNSTIKKIIFTSIYKSKHWVQNSSSLPEKFISVSGHGSNINTEQHKQLVKNFNKMISDFKINSILDMPCGDFLWIKEIINHQNIKYLGIDIVDNLVKENIKNYKSQNIDFKTADIVNYSTDEYFDLIVIRDLFIHINNSDITKIIKNLRSFNVKYIALNSYHNAENNEVVIGNHRKVNLLNEPFNLNSPLYSFKDYEDDKFFYLYDLKTL